MSHLYVIYMVGLSLTALLFLLVLTVAVKGNEIPAEDMPMYAVISSLMCACWPLFWLCVAYEILVESRS